MKNKRKVSKIPVIGFAVFIAAIVFSMTACDEPPPLDKGPFPAIADFEFSNMTQTAGRVTPITITPKQGKSTGAITTHYSGAGNTKYPQSTELPQTAGRYYAYFDVAAVPGEWGAVSGLSVPGEFNIVDPFSSIAAFKDWLKQQLMNTPATTYKVALNISDLGGSGATDGSLGAVLLGQTKIYVDIDLSTSTITSIPDGAFVGDILATTTFCATLTGITLPNSVTSIGEGAFSGCENLTKITIPAAVTSIGDIAFSGCSSLTSINIPNGVTNIGKNTFINCTSLTSITLPNSVTSIGEYAFSDCTSLTGVTLPNNLTTIKQEAFFGCTGLTSIIIPSGVTSIGSSAFEDCTNLTSVEFKGGAIDQNNFNLSAFGSDLYNKYFAPGGGEGKYTITSYDQYGHPVWTKAAPDIEDDVFTSIEDFADWLSEQDDNTADTAYIVKLSVDNISTLKTTLTSDENKNKYINLDLSGSTFTSIVANEFANCTSLTEITIPNSVTSIATDALSAPFNDCTSLFAINVGTGNTAYSSDDGVLYNKTKTKLIRYPRGKTAAPFVIPNSVTSIEQAAFRDCTGLTSVTLPTNAGFTILDGWLTFDGCTGLTSIIIPDNVTSIEYSIFSGCTNLANVTLSNNLTRIGNGAFMDCFALTSITIPNTVTSLGDLAFDRCTGLISIIIPASVTSIGNSAFSNCTSLISVEFKGTMTEEQFANANSFPGDLRTKYFAATGGGIGTYTSTGSGNSKVWTKS